MSFPVVSALYVAVLGFLGAGLTINVIVNRVHYKVDAGDGGVAKLAQAIRAQANFVEQAPLALLIIAFAEASGTNILVVHILGMALVAARLASAYALNRSLAQSSLRQFGAGISILVVVAGAAAIVVARSGLI
jgi:uncharacterized membrane protein YecN with MAPEG domain